MMRGPRTIAYELTNDLVTKAAMLTACLKYMSDQQVADMLVANEYHHFLSQNEFDMLQKEAGDE